MKRILITGANSYVGTSFEKWLSKSNDYYVETLDMKNKDWSEFDFSDFDTVFHVAGIVHQKLKKKDEFLYNSINNEMSIKLAQMCKEQGVHHFIFMSSMSVYGLVQGKIYSTTIPRPKTAYGKSKLDGENGIKKLESKKFIVTILRPPVIMGNNSPGNFNRLFCFIKKTRIFIVINNRRSVIHINDLCNYIETCITKELGGIYHPQNSRHYSVEELIKKHFKESNHKIILIKLPSLLKKFLVFNTFRKIFGDLYYTFDIDKKNLKQVS